MAGVGPLARHQRHPEGEQVCAVQPSSCLCAVSRAGRQDRVGSVVQGRYAAAQRAQRAPQLTPHLQGRRVAGVGALARHRRHPGGEQVCAVRPNTVLCTHPRTGQPERVVRVVQERHGLPTCPPAPTTPTRTTGVRGGRCGFKKASKFAPSLHRSTRLSPLRGPSIWPAQ